MNELSTGTAEAEADAALADVRLAEHDLSAGIREIGAPELHRLRDRFRHARLKANGEAEKAERARDAARLNGLKQLAAEVDKATGGPAIAELETTLRSIAGLCARFYALADAHDLMVGELVAAAQELGAEEMAPSGPRETSAFIGLSGGSIVHGKTVLRPVSATVLPALGLAQRGKADDAVAALRPVQSLRPPSRPGYLFRSPNGALIAMDSLSEVTDGQVRSGELVRLPEEQIDLWMKGELE